MYIRYIFACAIFAEKQLSRKGLRKLNGTWTRRLGDSPNPILGERSARVNVEISVRRAKLRGL